MPKGPETAPSFRWRAALLGGALLSLIVLTALLYSDFNRERDAQSWVAHTYQVLSEARGLVWFLAEAESAQRGYLLTADPRFLRSLEEALASADSCRRSLRRLTADNPSQQPRLDALDRLYEIRQERLSSTIRARDAAGLEAGARAAQSGDDAQLTAAFREAIEEIETAERTLLERRTAEAAGQSGRTRWLLGLGSGCLLALLVFAGAVIERDIRHRERSRQSLKQSEERLRLALDAAGAGAWEGDPGANEYVWSEEVWKLLGLPPHSFRPTREAWLAAVHPDDRDRVSRETAGAATAGELSLEFRAANVQGPPRWLQAHARALSGSQDGAHRFAGILLDITERKQAEEALREREQNLKRFTEAAPVAIAMFDRDMRYLAASTRFREDFRMADRDLAGKSHYQVFPEIPEQWREVHRRCLAGAAEHNDGELFLRADGSEQWIRWAIQPWRRADGQIGGIVLFSEDITRQMLSEKAVAESEAQFRTLANAIPQLCWMADADGWIFWYNQRWYDYTGTTAHQMAGWGWQSVHDPDVLPRVLERWSRSIARKEPFEMVFPLRGADGVFHPFLTRIVPVSDAAGKPVRWFGTNTDITGQSDIEAALRRASEQRRLAMDAAKLGAWEYHSATGELVWDENCRNMFGVSEGPSASYAEVLTRIHPEDRAGAGEAVQQALAGVNGGAYSREFRVVWPDGSIHWVASNGRAHADPASGGGPVRFIGVNMDVTGRKLADLEIRRLNAELEQRVLERTAALAATNKELEAFAYSVSHDLRAPLRGIDGWSLALLEDYAGQLDSQAQQYLQRVRSETQRMGELIDDLLQLSRITRAEIQTGPIDLSAIARAVAARLLEAHPGRRIEFSIGAGLQVEGDARLMEIALTNLLSNAVKFTGPRPEARIEFNRRDSSDTVFYIRDNGVGFDMAYAGNLFGAFQRLHKVSEFPGTGIGLATVQRIIHRHGGEIWGEAQPGLGATFYFTVRTP